MRVLPRMRRVEYCQNRKNSANVVAGRIFECNSQQKYQIVASCIFDFQSEIVLKKMPKGMVGGYAASSFASLNERKPGIPE